MTTITSSIIHPEEHLGQPREDVVFMVNKTETFEPVFSFQKLTVVDVQNYLTFLQPQIARLAPTEPEISNKLQDEFDRYNDLLNVMNAELDADGFV